MVQKDRDAEAQAEDARDAPRDAADAALAHAQAAAAAAAARRLTPSAAAAEHVSIAAMKRAAEFVKVRAAVYCPSGIPHWSGLEGTCSGQPVDYDLLVPTQYRGESVFELSSGLCLWHKS